MVPTIHLAHAASNGAPIDGSIDVHRHDQCTFLSSSSPSSYAPWYKVSHKSIVSVEHPFIIRNTEKGVISLGGPSRLQEVGSP